MSDYFKDFWKLAGIENTTPEQNAENQRAHAEFEGMMNRRSDREDFEAQFGKFDPRLSPATLPANLKLPGDDTEIDRGPQPWEMGSGKYAPKNVPPVPQRPVKTPFRVQGKVAQTAHDDGLALIKKMARGGQ